MEIQQIAKQTIEEKRKCQPPVGQSPMWLHGRASFGAEAAEMERHLEARHSAPAGRASPSSRQQGSSSRSWNRSSSPRRGSQQRGLGRLSRPAARLSRPPRARSSRPAARLSRPAARRGGAAPGRRGAAIARPCPPRGVGTAARRTDQPTPQGAPLMHVRHLPTYPSYSGFCL